MRSACGVVRVSTSRTKTMFPSDFDIFLPSRRTGAACTQWRTNFTPCAASLCAVSHSWCGYTRSLPPPWMSIGRPRYSSDIAEHSRCQPGRPRPGWHLECSAMSEEYLGLPIDIHGGGSDLVYPHHECETAQSEAAHGVKFVRHWVHAAPVRLDGKKMSKSLGNMVFVRDVLEDTTPQALRIYLLDRHYRRAFDHDEARLARARRRAVRLAATLGVGAVD